MGSRDVSGMKLMVVFLFSAVNLIILPSSALDSRQDFLQAHNEAREEVGVEPMVWDAEVAAAARSYAGQRRGDCGLFHSGGPFGENIAWGSDELSVGEAVGMWVGENEHYDHESNTCSAPAGGTCLHYTQVVWRESVKLGCAKVRCDTGGTFIVCNYDPPGNYIGQKPY